MFPDAAVTYLSPDLLNLKKKRLSWDFSGGPVVRILTFHCWGHKFKPLSNN